VTPDQPLKEALGGWSILSRLQVYINHFPVLVYSSPKAMLLLVDPHEHFIDLESVAVASVLVKEKVKVGASISCILKQSGHPSARKARSFHV
jgi:hypothetical protein